jgi:hypothetical protein
MNQITIGNSSHHQWDTSDFSEIPYQAIMVSSLKFKGKIELRIGSSKAYIVPDNEKNHALAAIHSQTLPAKNTSKYY